MNVGVDRALGLIYYLVPRNSETVTPACDFVSEVEINLLEKEKNYEHNSLIFNKTQTFYAHLMNI